MPSRNRGKPKPKLGDLSRVAPTDEERADVQNALERERSAITIAILGASQVEHELETELRDCFRRSDDETWKMLTDDRGPISTFSQKITMAYGLGVIDDVTLKSLNTIRQIRNAFAHTKRLINFENELVVRELKKVALPVESKGRLYRYLSSVRSVQYGARPSYVKLCLIVCVKLLERRTRRVKAKNARAETRYRRQILAKALDLPPSPRGGGLLELLTGYRSVDPRKTILGGAALSDRDLDASEPDKKDK